MHTRPPDRPSPSVALTLTLGEDSFTCDGPSQEVRGFLERWLIARQASDDPQAQAQIDRLVARTKTTTDALSAEIVQTTPTP